MKRDEWFDLSGNFDWDFSYVREEEVFPPEVSGRPWLAARHWARWDEPYRTTYAECVTDESDKERGMPPVRATLGRVSDSARIPRTWLTALKLHSTTVPLAEFAAPIGQVRAGRCRLDMGDER